jgi:hypothetical protein
VALSCLRDVLWRSVPRGLVRVVPHEGVLRPTPLGFKQLASGRNVIVWVNIGL